jgi:hypothetical protein
MKGTSLYFTVSGGLVLKISNHRDFEERWKNTSSAEDVFIARKLIN